MLYIRLQTILAMVLIGYTATGLSAEEKDKFSGEFYSTAKHFQTTGDVILIAEDGVHDPANITALYGLQPPSDAMGEFPRDDAGLIDWVQALQKGHVTPRSDLHGTGPELKPIDMDIEFGNTGAMPKVLFPHKAHTQWLACKNCHPAIFKEKKGANKFRMTDVFNGKYCGVCHGKVAFAPTKNCMRCHSVPK